MLLSSSQGCWPLATIDILFMQGVGLTRGKAADQPIGASDALADVPPTLGWVRLAQRFPVRITLKPDEQCQFHSGSTATVIVRGFEPPRHPG